MIYFKTTGDFKIDLEILAQEILNIQTNMSYFVNGELNENPKKGYNTYVLNGMEYEVFYSNNYIYWFGNITLKPEHVTDEIPKQFKKITDKYKETEPFIDNLHEFSHYVFTEEQINGIDCEVTNNKRVGKKKRGFKWIINNIGDSSGDTYSGLIEEIEKNKCNKSVSDFPPNSIIFDCIDILKYEHLHRTLEPLKLKMIKNKIYPSILHLCNTGIDLELYYRLPRIFKRKNKPSLKTTDLRQINFPIFEMANDTYENLAIENIKILTQNDNRTNSLGIFTEIRNAKTIEKFDRAKHGFCFITGIPLCEEVYVFKIYKLRIAKNYKWKFSERFGMRNARSYRSRRSNHGFDADVEYSSDIIYGPHERIADVDYCILLSRYALNVLGFGYKEYLEIVTGTNILVYRMKYPKRAMEYIDEIATDDIDRRVLTSLENRTFKLNPEFSISSSFSNFTKLCFNRNDDKIKIFYKDE